MKLFAIAFLMVATLSACLSDDGEVSITGNGGSSSGGNGTDAGNNSGSDNTISVGQPSSGIYALHRSGQTFLVWREAAGGVEYHVYRHNAPITSDNLGSATRLTDRWGPLDQNTSVNRYGSADVPRNFVISNSGQPLADDRGLFVHTTQNNQQGNAYYAVTSVVGGREDRTIVAGSNATTDALNESVSLPRPVLTVSTNGGKGRIYTQYMDYSSWNPTLKGYAFNFAVALPGNYNPSQSYPLRVYLHAYGELHKFVNQSEYDWPVIQLFPSDPGDSVNAVHSWWYGFASDHNYKTQGSVPRSGKVENFTEQRVLAAVEFLQNDGQFNIDRNLVHIFGHSMGGSGALTLGMRYPEVFAGIYASEPMTNYSASPEFQGNFSRLWGERSVNLPIVNGGRNNSSIRNYDSSGSQPTRVWNWMNHQEQLVRRRGDRFAYLMVDHGKADAVIDWQTQGRPMARVFTDARVGFSASALGGVGHSWLGFNSVVTSVFGFGFEDYNQGWIYPRNLSFPGIHNATGSGSLQPGNTGDDKHNTTLEWATPQYNFHQTIVDTSNRYEVSLRSRASNQTADITPRNTNSFRPGSGTRCSWNANSIADNRTLGSGTATVDGNRLLTVNGVSILAGSGTRLSINCP